jgi:hypothetical protein
MADARALRAAVRDAVRQNQFAALDADNASEHSEDGGEPIERGEQVQGGGFGLAPPAPVGGASWQECHFNPEFPQLDRLNDIVN